MAKILDISKDLWTYAPTPRGHPRQCPTVIACMYDWHQCATVIDPRLNLTGYFAGSGV